MEHLKPLRHVMWRKAVGVASVRSGWEARGLLDTGSLWTLSGWSCQLIPQGKGRGCWQVCECVCVAYHLNCSNDVEKVCFLDKKAEKKAKVQLWTMHRAMQMDCVCAQINSGTALLCLNTGSVELDLPCQRPLRIGCETCMLLDKQAVYWQ